MLVIELSKSYCNNFYNNDFNAMIKALDGVIFDDVQIKKAFNFGNGSIKDFKAYINNNKSYCKYYDLINKKYL